MVQVIGAGVKIFTCHDCDIKFVSSEFTCGSDTGDVEVVSDSIYSVYTAKCPMCGRRVKKYEKT